MVNDIHIANLKETARNASAEIKKAFHDFFVNIHKPPVNKPVYRKTLNKKQQRW